MAHGRTCGQFNSFKLSHAMKKLLLAVPFVLAAVLFCSSARAQQNAPKEDLAYQLPALISEKTVPMLDQVFAGMPGVKIVAYCYNLDLIVFEVDRSVQPDDEAIRQKIHSVFHTDDTTLKVESVKTFNRGGYLALCNATDLVTR